MLRRKKNVMQKKKKVPFVPPDPLSTFLKLPQKRTTSMDFLFGFRLDLANERN